jgi:23S rRNA (uridine2552-2'-O)-methyltransferase
MDKKRRRSRGKPWQDHYTRRARGEKYPARSVYKLEEIQKKVRLIRPGDRVLDLGCAPGSWLILAAGLTGPTGSVIGIDITPVTIPLPDGAAARVGDVFEPDAVKALGSPFEVVMSDMAPSTTGNRVVDTARSAALCERALEIAEAVLVEGGRFVCKIFQGEDLEAVSDRVRKAFETHRTFKPQSSRKASREIYLIGLGKR